MFSAQEIFDVAVQIEENGARFYHLAIEAGADPSLKELLLWLANEELRHRDTFLTMRRGMAGSGADHPAESAGRVILRGAVDHHALSLDDVDFAAITESDDLLRVAIEFEEDSIRFYEILLSFVDDPDIVGQVAEINLEEKEHIRLLEERRLRGN